MRSARAQIKHPCAHIVFASAFKALASYIVSCISAPSSNILACEEKNMLERAQNALSKLSPARAQTFSCSLKTFLCSRKIFSCSLASQFF